MEPANIPNMNNGNDPANWGGDERQFGTGLIGARWFKTNDAGYLTGAYHSEYIYNKGTNDASCASQLSMFRFSQIHIDHQVASKGCRCGFYAYFDESHITIPLYEIQDSVLSLGIIEAWGKATIGPLGFRASNCRIVALIHPAKNVAVVYDNSAVFSDLGEAVREFPLTKV